MTHSPSGAFGTSVQAPNDVLFFMDILDSASDCAFDRIARVAAVSLDMPVVLIALADGNRQVFKSVIGVHPGETEALHAICARLNRSEELAEVCDTAGHAEFAGALADLGGAALRYYAGAPIRSLDGQRAGTLAVFDRTPRRLTPQQRRLLLDLASLAAHELEIRRVAATDPLTGAWNRRMLEQVAHNEFRRARRLKRPFSLAVMDLDHFKAVNDRFGHDAGNDALRSFARTFRAVMRAEDCLFRVGGEEFIALLTGSGLNEALSGVERLRGSVEALQIKSSEGVFKVTISGAVIEATDASGTPRAPLSTLIREADMGLYTAKRRGRNRIIPVDAHSRPDSQA